MIDEHVSEKHAVVYTDGSVHHGNSSVYCFSARIRSKLVAERNGAYRSTTSSMRLEVAAITVVWIWF